VLEFVEVVLDVTDLILENTP